MPSHRTEARLDLRLSLAEHSQYYPGFEWCGTHFPAQPRQPGEAADWRRAVALSQAASLTVLPPGSVFPTLTFRFSIEYAMSP